MAPAGDREVVDKIPEHHEAVGLRRQPVGGGVKKATVSSCGQMHKESGEGHWAADVVASHGCEYLPMCVAYTGYRAGKSCLQRDCFPM